MLRSRRRCQLCERRSIFGNGRAERILRRRSEFSTGRAKGIRPLPGMKSIDGQAEEIPTVDQRFCGACRAHWNVTRTPARGVIKYRIALCLVAAGVFRTDFYPARDPVQVIEFA